jgi:hypothetical protein
VLRFLRPIGAVIHGEPCGERRRTRARCLDLTKGDPDGRAPKTISVRRDRERFMACRYRVNKPLFEHEALGITVLIEHCLERVVTLCIERTTAAWPSRTGLGG